MAKNSELSLMEQNTICPNSRAPAERNVSILYSNLLSTFEKINRTRTEY
jgi:hypothetical protein